MILPNPKEAIHKAWLYRILREIYDNPFLAQKLYFKGGTCAAMRDLLDRFSIDLDFDYMGNKKELRKTQKNLEIIFNKLGLVIKDKSKKIPQYFLKYPREKETLRNTIKIDTTFPPYKSNKYSATKLTEIDRIAYCQTIETMFANKLVALIDRWEKNKTIAGRDLYDIHYFFMRGFRYSKAVIKERRKEKSLRIFFKKLVNFIKEKITQKIIDQDINSLFVPKKFQQTRKILKDETIMFLNDEIKRIK